MTTVYSVRRDALGVTLREHAVPSHIRALAADATSLHDTSVQLHFPKLQDVANFTETHLDGKPVYWNVKPIPKS